MLDAAEQLATEVIAYIDARFKSSSLCEQAHLRQQCPHGSCAWSPTEARDLRALRTLASTVLEPSQS
jgi:hypothetical protein